MDRLSIGDIVRLRSGGPLMTVRKLSKGKKEADCVWFNRESELRDNVFATELLVIISDR